MSDGLDPGSGAGQTHVKRAVADDCAEFALPLIDRWAGWLANPRARDPQTGHWWSWVGGPAAYAYPEATAWVVQSIAQLRDHKHLFSHSPQVADLIALGDNAAATLAQCAQAGFLQRHGRGYAFDTAVGLASLLAWNPHHPAIVDLRRGLDAFLTERHAVVGGPRWGESQRGHRWSAVWGPHLAWLAIPLRKLGETQLALTVAAQVRTDHAALPDYAHALAYACEGQAAVADLDPQARQWLDLGLARLAEQADRAGVRADRRQPSPLRADATAQAIALAAQWQGRSPPTHSNSPPKSPRAPIWDADQEARGLTTEAYLCTPQGGKRRSDAEMRPKRGIAAQWPTLSSLAALTTISGAVRYEPGSPCANTWCTAMAIDAALAVLNASADDGTGGRA
ncbi:MAG: hypothetical protein EXR77_08395 [Myxococcales bacterium]|nr:hypothetical protein [Myxococcales bacterium]